MKTRLIPLIAAVGAVALALTLVSTSQAGKSEIIETDHDLASPGSPTCEHCHLPHKANDMYLWALDPDPDYTGESEVLPLCYSCHDNTVANGSYIPDAEHNHPQGVVQYDPDHIPDSGDEYPITEHERYESSCKKCMEPDCVKCHDAHSDTWVFLDSNRFDPFDYDEDGDDEEFMNASVCSWCHEGSRHGVESYDDEGNVIPHTTHPEMITQPDGADEYDPPVGADRRWWGDTGDLSGTRLWTDDTTYHNQPGDDTQYYVETSNPGDIRCMTCHTPHAGQAAELESMGYELVPAVGAPETGAQCENVADDDGDGVANDGCPNSAICINCHE